MAGLTRQGLALDWVQSMGQFDAALARQGYDCLLLGLKPLDVEGFTLLENLRRRGDNTPLIVLSAPSQTAMIVSLLDRGADDFMLKPCDFQELMARMRALLRRASKAEPKTALLHGPLELHVEGRLAVWHGAPVPLTMKEFWLLEVLVRQRSRVLTRSQIEDSLYGWGDETGSNTVEVYIHRLRKKFSNQLIVTLRGMGYQLGQISAIEA